MNEQARLWLETRTLYLTAQILNTLETRPQLAARTVLDLCEHGYYNEAVQLTEALEKQAKTRERHGEYLSVRPGAKKVG
jgi:predicted Zn-ribbon and HTH transcriptional regulator